MNPKDWTLLVIAAAKDRPLQPVQLQKSLFLLGRRLSNSQLQVAGFYEFEPYDYGPFCRTIYFDADDLSKEGLVHIDQQRDLSFRLYSTTGPGRERAAHFRTRLDEKTTRCLDEIIRWVQSLPFRQLVAAIYSEFPEMKVNSVFQG
jgi:hypothetical protein